LIPFAGAGSVLYLLGALCGIGVDPRQRLAE
jgi:hypothetical protein